jgi:hypothetical protein
MFLGLWNTARANKENIFYTILTIFLLVPFDRRP